MDMNTEYRDENYDRVNDEFLDVAQQAFVDAVQKEDLRTARMIIADLADNGFTQEAETLKRNLMYMNDGV